MNSGSVQWEQDKWFVEEFHLRSPVEEFQEHARIELDRIADAHEAKRSSCRNAVDLVIARLRGEEGGRP